MSDELRQERRTVAVGCSGPEPQLVMGKGELNQEREDVAKNVETVGRTPKLRTRLWLWSVGPRSACETMILETRI